jgi:hypothetical protein
MTQKRFKKRRIALVLIVVTMFFAAYARHKLNQPVTTGRLEDKQMDEISGIAASAVNADLFYVHNDSGDTSRFFAINTEGKLKATYYFKGMAGG